ncbi:putative 1-acyl-sn-glycerol-3-phosphate acyltransferase acl-12 [Aphelenchoides bicaudatus]|nr:putative 1-acyl-sn-glycerol-3-phosphate acyltransferase acl-12 [Aphelenchoides bicaudatus]
MIIEQHLDERAEAKNLGVSTEDKMPNGSLMDLRKLFGLVGAFYWLAMTVFIVPFGCVISLYTIIYPLVLISWILRLELKFVSRIENFLCQMVNDHWTAAGQYMGLQVCEYGDDITEIADKRVLFLCNHLGLVDHFVLMTAMYNKKTLPGRYLWVIFNIWKFTPLGFMWTSHGNFFINGGQAKRAAILNDFREHLRRLYWQWNYGTIVMYPEGSRLFLIKEAEKRFAREKWFEAVQVLCTSKNWSCSYSLVSLWKIIESLDETKANAGNFPPLEYVVDCTLGYPNGEVVDLGQAMLGDWPRNNSNVAVHYSIHKVKSEWQDEEKLKEWLYKRYEEKDKLLEHFYAKGTFNGKPRPVNFPMGFLIHEDISNCNQSLNAPVKVYNRVENKGPDPFTYTNEMVFRFEPSSSSNEELKCHCSDYYNEDGTVKVPWTTIIQECGLSDCKLGKLRGGLKTKLQIAYSKRRRFWEVLAQQPIKKGTYIIDYTGEIYEDFVTTEDDYIFYVADSDENSIFPLKDDGTRQSWIINAHKFGNVSRFFNHSCTANLTTYFVRVGNEPFLRVAFFSSSDILRGEELTLNYGNLWWEAKGFKCLCGSDECLHRKSTI